MVTAHLKRFKSISIGIQSSFQRFPSNSLDFPKIACVCVLFICCLVHVLLFLLTICLFSFFPAFPQLSILTVARKMHLINLHFLSPSDVWLQSMASKYGFKLWLKGSDLLLFARSQIEFDFRSCKEDNNNKNYEANREFHFLCTMW